MDKRDTFDNINHLHAIVSALYEQEQKVSLLVDDSGLVRHEGVITRLQESIDENRIFIVINNATDIYLRDIIGINGVFRSDYSEC